jgi:hypothetical protein
MEAMSTTAPKLLDRCNLIINYLPQDMDDHGLRVRAFSRAISRPGKPHFSPANAALGNAWQCG